MKTLYIVGIRNAFDREYIIPLSFQTTKDAAHRYAVGIRSVLKGKTGLRDRVTILKINTLDLASEPKPKPRRRSA